MIEERKVPLPNDWTHLMALSDNKADYARFLSEELIMQAPEGKEIIVILHTVNYNCHTLIVS